MKIGLIIHSVTGNTLKVANQLLTVLADKGHDVELKEIKTATKIKQGETKANFTELPELDGYDALVFGSHTEAFQLELTMKLYFKQLKSLKDCKVACISTHQFPFAWLGGNSAVNMMKSMCEEKGATVLGTAVVDWSPEKKRNEKIADAVNKIVALF